MSRRSQRGIGATVIIAIVVVLATLGAALVTTITTQQSALAIDVLSARAYQSARVGIEYGIFHVLRAGAPDCAAITGTTMPMTGNLAGIRVTITCSSNSHTEGATSVTMSEITANACTATAGNCPQAASTAGYVERELRVAIGSD